MGRSFRDPWVWGQLALVLAVGIGTPVLPRLFNFGRLDPLLGMVDPTPWRVVGAIIAAGGVGVAVWGARSLGANLTPSTIPLDPSSLVEDGAYAWVRHPIYLGLIIALMGYALAAASLPWAALTGLIANQFFTAKARAEERHLIQRHPGYAAYQKRVGMVWPGGKTN